MSPPVISVSSCAGVLSLLEDSDVSVQKYALQNLNLMVDQFWPEIADALVTLETMSEDESFESKSLASLIASKVYFHLGEMADALQYAFGAGPLFDLSVRSEYVETLISTCVDEYIQKRVEKYPLGTDGIPADSPVDPRMEMVMTQMFDRCFRDGEFKQVLGIAIECRRLDIISQCIIRVPDNHRRKLIDYTFDACMNLVSSRKFRQIILQMLVTSYSSVTPPDYISMAHCLVLLDDAENLANILVSKLLPSQDKKDHLLAYQIAFDLCDNAPQHLLIALRRLIPKSSPVAAATTNSGSIDNNNTSTNSSSTSSSSNNNSSSSSSSSSSGNSGDNADNSGSGADNNNTNSNTNALFDAALTKLNSILSGEKATELQLEFLYRNNKADLHILNALKGTVETRQSVFHLAVVIANSIMHCGTTVDTFLRENLEWFGRATNWAKFSSTAAFGVIHKGHLKQALTLLNSYLPQPGNTGGSQYSEGGALYALGLIHVNNGPTIMPYLSNALTNAGNNVIVQHGACLALGLAGMATCDEALYDRLKNILWADNAVAGEAAGYAMGLVMLGSASPAAIQDMITYASETQHEKIIRGLAMGIALTLYGQEDSAEVVIEQLLGDKDPILRYGGVYAIAMAFAGTASNWAIRKLLYVAVSDVSPDVRRGAVTALGFVLVRRPESVPKMVALLAESYNPHVRYGSAMAVGIACAGTGQKSAIDLLLILAKDRVDFVRQGALISLALVLQQINVTQEPSVKVVREMFEKVTKDKHEDLLAKFGAIIATGIIDAGGRNTVVKLSNRFGHRNMNGIVGMAMFCQYWSWFPLLHFFSLASMPTAIIGLNADLQMPAFTFTSNSKPSTFAYPEPMKAPEKKDVAKLPTAVLSTTAKAKARQEKKEKEGGAAAATTSTASAISSPMTTTASATIPTSASTNDVEMKEKDADTSGASPATGSASLSQKDATATGAAATTAAASTAAVAAPEPTSEKKQNPSRVTLLQINQIVFDAECKYQPISTRGRSFGITMVFNTNPDEKEEIIASSVPASTAPGAVADVPLPQEFDFVE